MRVSLALWGPEPSLVGVCGPTEAPSKGQKLQALNQTTDTRRPGLGAVFRLCTAGRAGRAGWLVALFIAAYAPSALAQRAFYLDRVQIGGSPQDGLVSRRPFVGQSSRIFGSLTAAYVLNPLRASTVALNSSVESKLENLVTHQALTYFNAGVEIGGRAALSITLPVAWYQASGDIPAPGARAPLPRLNPVGVGAAHYDVSLEARVVAVGGPEADFRLGFGGAFFVPSGTFSHAASDDSASLYLYATGEQALGPLLVTGSVGPHFRPLVGIGGQDSRLDVGSEVRLTGGVFLDLHDRFRVGGEVNGSVSFDDDEAGDSMFLRQSTTPFEWLGSVRLGLGKSGRTFARASAGTRFTNGYGAPDLRVMVSLGRWVSFGDLLPEDKTRSPGEPTVLSPPEPELDTDRDGYPDTIDACPQQPEDGEEPGPYDGCPAESDRDDDGVFDADDECPDSPEDPDGIADQDGCPERDADGDGVPDETDVCPLRPGPYFGDPSRDGCPAAAQPPPPEAKVVVDEEGQLRLLEPIRFATGTADIQPSSYALLDDVALVLQERPGARMAVHGHTDSQGSIEFNVGLSRRRAQAVAQYLVDHGIVAERLEAEGFGPSRPVADNTTEQGRARNRRVEFKLLE